MMAAGVRDMLAREAGALGIQLDSQMLDSFDVYCRELQAWSSRANLTAVRGDEEVAIKHFLDSLTCLLAVELAPGATVVDVGSGAGFPGIPLKIARPGIRLTLIEARRKRVDFLTHLIETAGLSDVQVVWDRAENVGRTAQHRESYRVAVARGVAELAVLAELCLPLVEVGGVMVAQKGPEVAEEVAAGSVAVETLGGRVERLVGARLPAGFGDRTLVVVCKVSHSPAMFPRRPGVPEKRPIA